MNDEDSFLNIYLNSSIDTVSGLNEHKLAKCLHIKRIIRNEHEVSHSQLILFVNGKTKPKN